MIKLYHNTDTSFGILELLVRCVNQVRDFRTKEYNGEKVSIEKRGRDLPMHELLENALNFPMIRKAIMLIDITYQLDILRDVVKELREQDDQEEHLIRQEDERLRSGMLITTSVVMICIEVMLYVVFTIRGGHDRNAYIAHFLNIAGYITIMLNFNTCLRYRNSTVNEGIYAIEYGEMTDVHEARYLIYDDFLNDMAELARAIRMHTKEEIMEIQEKSRVDLYEEYEQYYYMLIEMYDITCFKNVIDFNPFYKKEEE